MDHGSRVIRNMDITPYRFVAKKPTEGCFGPEVISDQSVGRQAEVYDIKVGKSKDQLKPLRTKESSCLPLTTSYFSGR